jgi:hypothetical protein
MFFFRREVIIGLSMCVAISTGTSSEGASRSPRDSCGSGSGAKIDRGTAPAHRRVGRCPVALAARRLDTREHSDCAPV